VVFIAWVQRFKLFVRCGLILEVFVIEKGLEGFMTVTALNNFAHILTYLSWIALDAGYISFWINFRGEALFFGPAFVEAHRWKIHHYVPIWIQRGFDGIILNKHLLWNYMWMKVTSHCKPLHASLKFMNMVKIKCMKAIIHLI
jgi:hypothetical protein